MEYIDVRGCHPVYVNGVVAVELSGCNRNITVAEARLWLGLNGISISIRN